MFHPWANLAKNFRLVTELLPPTNYVGELMTAEKLCERILPPTAEKLCEGILLPTKSVNELETDETHLEEERAGGSTEKIPLPKSMKLSTDYKLLIAEKLFEEKKNGGLNKVLPPPKSMNLETAKKLPGVVRSIERYEAVNRLSNRTLPPTAKKLCEEEGDGGLIEILLPNTMEVEFETDERLPEDVKMDGEPVDDKLQKIETRHDKTAEKMSTAIPPEERIPNKTSQTAKKLFKDAGIRTRVLQSSLVGREGKLHLGIDNRVDNH